MADPRGFLEVHRVPSPERDPGERVGDYGEIYQTLPEDEVREQASRCMDCGVPFCNSACPLGNLIPDWNDLARVGDWKGAIDQLHATNNFPEFTGLICPAPCESACVLDIDDDPVMIKQIEYWTINNAFEQGWVVAQPPSDDERTGRRVAVVGSGPAGMAAAAELNKVGHSVTVYEKDEAPGGLLRFGVPDAKLEKWIIDRRTRLLEEEGIEFVCDVEVGVNLPADEVLASSDAVVVAVGSRVERDLDLPGRELDGVHFAMEYLYGRNRWVAAEQGRVSRETERPITAAGKRVVVIGGGDTGMDCVSNALREGAEDVILLDVYPEVPKDGRYPNTPWPIQPRRLLTTYALDEGGKRTFGREVIGLEGPSGAVERVRVREVTGDSSRNLVGVEGSDFTIDAELVLIAVGFTHPEREGLLDGLAVDLDSRGNVKAGAFTTSVERVYAAGDARVGASLVVTAIAEGRRCARVVEAALRA